MELDDSWKRKGWVKKEPSEGALWEFDGADDGRCWFEKSQGDVYAFVYHNEGEEAGSLYLFGVFVEVGRNSDGDCTSTLELALLAAERLIKFYQQQ